MELAKEWPPIEWIRDTQKRRFKVVIFDFDGTISLIREGWQQIMYAYFFEILKEAPNAEPDQELLRVIKDFVDYLTGKQTIYQTIRLVEEFKVRGGTPQDPIEYKREYNRRVLKHIQERVYRLKTGAIDPGQLLVTGSESLLQTLRRKDLTLYLASGTDEEYVLEEAKALGIDKYFNGGIFGSLDDYQRFSKAQVIQNIIQSHSIAGDELLGFGDGFVEIENVKEVGGVAVGVASDEKKQLEIDLWKRNRLIKAGADAIIGDYRCQQELLSSLLGEGVS